MNDVDRGARIRAAAGAIAAGFAVFLSAKALAAPVGLGEGIGEANWMGGFAVGALATPAGEGADISAECGKCHSACEEGSRHANAAQSGATGNATLPLGDGSRVTCSTCHEAHRGEGTSAAQLRMSNLRRELCLACHQGDGDAPRVRIVSPLEQANVREDRVAFIGSVSGLATAELTVRLNGAPFHLHVKDGKFFTWLSLQDGVNRIEVARDDQPLWAGEIFHGGGVSGALVRTTSAHGTASREECFGCHERGSGMSAETAGPAPTLCYGCHDQISGKRYVHGPTAVGDCLACHDPHGGLGSAHLRQEQGLLCRTCHSERASAPQTACDVPGKGCVACHDPHQSDARYLLKGPQYTLLDGQGEIATSALH